MRDKYGNTACVDPIRVNRNGREYESMYRVIVKDRNMTVIHVSIHNTEEEAIAEMRAKMEEEK